MQTEPDAAGTRADDLLAEYGVEPEVADSAAAVLLVDLEAEQSLLARLEPDAAVDDPRLLPLGVMGNDVALQETANGGTERVMVLGVEVALHPLSIGSEPSGVRSGQVRSRSNQVSAVPSGSLRRAG